MQMYGSDYFIYGTYDQDVSKGLVEHICQLPARSSAVLIRGITVVSQNDAPCRLSIVFNPHINLNIGSKRDNFLYL
uniref:NTF2 domain-containing protein n=1 Tax=Steinernema glaseri TaxID=37863 RepID=A0A1I7ZPR8_9BILA